MITQKILFLGKSDFIILGARSNFPFSEIETVVVEGL